MLQDTVQTFISWLDAILSEKNLNCQKLTQKAGISHTVISKARNGKLPKWEACNALATALNVSPVEVFIAAGLLPDQPEFDADFERVAIIYRTLSLEKRRLFIELLQVLIDSSSSAPEE
jgi:DNA-binding Xre family transcriptional regulator